MKTKEVKIGAFLSYTQIIVSVLVSLIYTPAMLQFLGKAEYGVYSIATSTVSYLNLFNMGFGSSYLRFYTKDKVDGLDVSKTNALFLSVFFILGFLAFISGIIIVQNVRLIFADGLTQNEYVILEKIMYILTVTTVCNLVTTIFSSIITAHEKFIFQKSVNLLKTIFSPCANWILLAMGYRSVVMALVTAVICISVDVINVYFCISKLQVKFTFRNMQIKRLKEIASFSAFVGLNLLIEELNWNIDKIILGRYRGSSETAVYSLAAYIQALYAQVAMAIYTMFIPKVNVMVAEGQSADSINKFFIKIGRLQLMTLLPVLIGFVFFGRQFVSIWAPPGYDRVYLIAIILIIPATVSYTQNIGVSIQTAMNRHRPRAIVYTIMAILNVFISVPLAKQFGAVGSAIGTAISLIFANGIFMNIYYHKALKLNMIEFWSSMKNFLTPILVSSLAGFALTRFFTITNFVSLVCYAVIFCIVYLISLWLFTLNDIEKNLFGSVTKKLRSKK